MSKGSKWLVKGCTALVAVVAITFSGGVAATAAIAPGGGGGAIDCQPMTFVRAAGKTITFNGYTRCTNALGFELQIAFNKLDGPGHYSKIKTCRGPLAGESTNAQFSCGVNGVEGTLTDSVSGTQQWCMNTLIVVGNGKRIWSLPQCIKH